MDDVYVVYLSRWMGYVCCPLLELGNIGLYGFAGREHLPIDSAAATVKYPGSYGLPYGLDILHQLEQKDWKHQAEDFPPAAFPVL